MNIRRRLESLAWYRFLITKASASAAARILAIPGVIDRSGTPWGVSPWAGGRGQIVAHDNCAWIVADLLEADGAVALIETSAPDLPTLASLGGIDSVVKHGLREWVPEFMLGYQRDCALALAHRGGHLHHSTGAGKTLSAIVCALAYGPVRTLVVTKASVRRGFGRAIERFTTHRAAVIETGSDFFPLFECACGAVVDEPSVIEVANHTRYLCQSCSGRLTFKKDGPLFLVVGWESLAQHLDQILYWNPNTVIWDEIHKMQSTKRWEGIELRSGAIKFIGRDNLAHAAYQIARATKRRFGASATPIPDRIRNIWAQLDNVHPDAWGPFYREGRGAAESTMRGFAVRYCAARHGNFGGIDTTGSSNGEELSKRIAAVAHNVPMAETHKSLPSKRRQVTRIPASQQVRVAGFGVKDLKALAGTLGGGSHGVLQARLMEAAARKRKFLVERIQEAVEGGQKVVVFTGRKLDVDHLVDSLMSEPIFGGGPDGKTGVALFHGHGDQTPKERDTIAQLYAASPGPAVLVGTGHSFGTGVDGLQDSDLLLIAMLPFTPGEIIQWEGRVARLGQKRPVLIEYLVAEETVDEHVVEIQIAKLPSVERATSNDAVAGLANALAGDETEEELVKSIFEKLGLDMSGLKKLKSISTLTDPED